MRLQLIFTNHARCLAGVRAFTRETLRQWPFAEAVAEKLGECVIAAASNAIDHAYPVGEEGSIELTIREQGGKFQFLVRDYGLPIDAAELERQLHDSSVPANRKITVSWPGSDVVDEFHWIGFGRDGKAIQIVKWLHEDHIADSGDASLLHPFKDDAPLAPPHEYTIRRMRPDEASQVSQLMYRAYGNTYFNEDVRTASAGADQNGR